MTEQNCINFVIEKLNEYPNIQYNKKNDNELEIVCRDANGFDILIQTNPHENTLHFGTFHCHFENSEEETDKMLLQLFFGLTGISRLKQYSKNGKAYKWILQVQDKEGNWFDTITMGLLNLNFWTKAEINYLQNDLLPKEIVYTANDTEQ